MRITGTLLDIEDYSGTSKGDDGQPFDYSGQRLHVLDGREVTRVKVPKTLIGVHGYGRGELVDLHVSVQAQAGARGAYLTVTLVGDYKVLDDAMSFSA